MANFISPTATFITLLLPFLYLCTTPSTAQGIVELGKFDIVRDVNGNNVKSNSPYYIIPYYKIKGQGGVGMLFKQTCPSFVAKESSETSLGLPVRFFPQPITEIVNPPASGEVPVNYKPIVKVLYPREVAREMSTNIIFDSPSNDCPNDYKAWQVIEEGEPRRKYVKSGAAAGTEDDNNIWFQIRKVIVNEDPSNNNIFKIRYCPQPKPGTSRDLSCEDIGDVLDEQSNRKQLIVGGDGPFLVQFKPAN